MRRHHTEFRAREETVVATLNELQLQAQSVMDVISNPEVVSALRQDKLHNLSYLKDTHNVSLVLLTIVEQPKLILSRSPSLLFFCVPTSGYSRSNRPAIPIWTIPILHRTLLWCFRLPIPFPRFIHRLGSRPFFPLGQTRFRHP